MSALWDLCRFEGYTVLIVAHTPKRSKKEPLTIDAISGSSKLGQLCDGAIGIGEIDTDDGSKKYIIQVKNRNNEITFGKGNIICTNINITDTGLVRHFSFALAKEVEALTGNIDNPDFESMQKKKESVTAYLLYGSYREAEKKINIPFNTIKQRVDSFKAKEYKEYKEIVKLSKAELRENLIIYGTKEDELPF